MFHHSEQTTGASDVIFFLWWGRSLVVPTLTPLLLWSLSVNQAVPRACQTSNVTSMGSDIQLLTATLKIVGNHCVRGDKAVSIFFSLKRELLPVDDVTGLTSRRFPRAFLILFKIILEKALKWCYPVYGLDADAL